MLSKNFLGFSQRMEPAMSSICRLIATLLIGVLLTSLVLDFSFARPKTEMWQCRCACEYPDENGKWHWGDDVDFTSTDCYVGAGLKWTCVGEDGHAHEGGHMLACTFRYKIPFERLRQPRRRLF
jgi:hypothetical protein